MQRRSRRLFVEENCSFKMKTNTKVHNCFKCKVRWERNTRLGSFVFLYSYLNLYLYLYLYPYSPLLLYLYFAVCIVFVFQSSWIAMHEMVVDKHKAWSVESKVQTGNALRNCFPQANKRTRVFVIPVYSSFLWFFIIFLFWHSDVRICWLNFAFVIVVLLLPHKKHNFHIHGQDEKTIIYRFCWISKSKIINTFFGCIRGAETVGNFPRWNLLRYRAFRITFISLPKRKIRAELNSIQFPASLFWVPILSFGHFKVLNSIHFIKKTHLFFRLI